MKIRECDSTPLENIHRAKSKRVSIGVSRAKAVRRHGSYREWLSAAGDLADGLWVGKRRSEFSSDGGDLHFTEWPSVY
jgi:hypothetical protein